MARESHELLVEKTDPALAWPGHGSTGQSARTELKPCFLINAATKLAVASGRPINPPILQNGLKNFDVRHGLIIWPGCVHTIPAGFYKLGFGATPLDVLSGGEQTLKCLAKSAGNIFAELWSKIVAVRSNALATNPEQVNWPSIPKTNFALVIKEKATLTIVTQP